MKSIKKFLRLIDVFAVPISFRYKQKNYYSTSLGGLFIILFTVVILIVGIYYSIPFLNRKNFTIVYYTQTLPKTESIIFKDSHAAFAYGFDCGKIVNGMAVTDVLKLESRYVVYKKNYDGTINKEQYTLSTHSCGYKDFYYKYNDAVDYLSLGKYHCLDDNSHTIQGIYSDQVFSYYEFAAVAINGTEQNYKDIDTFLLYNDCKLQFYYTDITFDLVNYEQPIKPYLNSLFIQFDLTLFIKRNVFFMNQYLYDDNYLIWNFGDDDIPDVRTLFSRYEEYALYEGMNRTYSKRDDRMNYARIYIRADTKRTDVKRRYQKLMEFYADLSSLMIALYRLMVIFFNYMNTFYAMHSVAKKIFFFKEIEYNNKFNIFRKNKNIYDIIDLTEEYYFNNNEIINEESLELTEKKEFVNQNKNNKNNPPPKYQYNKYDTKNKYQKKDIKEISNSNQSKLIKSKNIEFNNSIYRRKNQIMLNENMNMNIPKNLNVNIYNLKNNYVNKINLDSSVRTKIEEYPVRKKRYSKINYKFNIFEAIIVSFFYCCLCKKLKRKNNINEKANDIIFRKMDIVTYVRYMLIFDILINIMLTQNKINIINLLSRPVISLDKNDKYPFYEFNNNYNKINFEEFSGSIYDLVQNTPNKKIEEKKLIFLSNKHLKDFI